MSVISLSSDDEEEVVTLISQSQKRTSDPLMEDLRFEQEDQPSPEEGETDPFMDDRLEEDVDEILPELNDDSAGVQEVDLGKILAEQDSVTGSEEITEANEISTAEAEGGINPTHFERPIVPKNLSVTDSTQKMSKLQLLAIQLAETMANCDSSMEFVTSSPNRNDSKMTEQKCHDEPIVVSGKPGHSISTDSNTDLNLMENSTNEGVNIHNSIKKLCSNSNDVIEGVTKKKRGRKKGWRKYPKSDGTTTVDRLKNSIFTKNQNLSEKNEINIGLYSTPGDNLPVKDLHKVNVPKKRGRPKGRRKCSETNEPNTVNNNNNNKINVALLNSEIETMNLNDHDNTLCTVKEGVVSTKSQGQEGTIHSNSNKKTSPEKYKKGWKKRLLQREGISGSVKLGPNEGHRKRKNKCLDIATLDSMEDSNDHMIRDENKKIKYLVDNNALNVHVNIQVTEVRPKIKIKGNQVSSFEESISKRKKVHKRKKVSFENSNDESTISMVPNKELSKTDLVNKVHSANSVRDLEDSINRNNRKVGTNVNETSNDANCDQSSPLDEFNSLPKSLTHESLESFESEKNPITDKIMNTSKFTEGDSIFNDDLFRFLHFEGGDNINERVNVKDPMPSSIEMDHENIPCPGRDYVNSYNIVFDDDEEYTCMQMGDILHLSLNEFVNLKMRLDTTSKLTCDKLRAKEVSSALQYYRESYSHYKKTFQNLFSNIYDKIFNNPIIIESFKKYRRVLLLTWFNKLYLRVVTLSPDFNESLENMRTYIMSGLLSNVHLQYPFVEQAFAISASEFEKECWMVLGLMQDCYTDDLDVEPSTTDCASTENNTYGLENAHSESIGNNDNAPSNESVYSSQMSQNERVSNFGEKCNSDKTLLDSTFTSKSPKEKCMENLPNENVNTNIGCEPGEAGQAIASLNNYSPSHENTCGPEKLHTPRSTVICGPINGSSLNKASMLVTDQPVNTLSVRSIDSHPDNIYPKSVISNANSTYLQSRCSVLTDQNDVFQIQRQDLNIFPNRCMPHRGDRSSHTMPNVLSKSSTRNVQSTYLDNDFNRPITSNTTSGYNKGIRVVDTRDLMNNPRGRVTDSDNRNGKNSKRRMPYHQVRPPGAVPNTIPSTNVAPPSYADHVRRYGATTSDGYFQRRYNPNMYTNHPNLYQYHYNPKSATHQRPSLQGCYLNGQNRNYPQSTNPAMTNSAGVTPSFNYSGLTRKEVYMGHYLQSLYGSDLYRQFVNHQAQYQYGPSTETSSHQMVGQNLVNNGEPSIHSARRLSFSHALDYSHMRKNPVLPNHPGLPEVSINGTPSVSATAASFTATPTTS